MGPVYDAVTMIVMPLGCARFLFLQNFSERQILWRLCSVVLHALTLKLPIQISFSVAPKLPVSLHSGERSEKFMTTSTLLNDEGRAPVTSRRETN